MKDKIANWDSLTKEQQNTALKLLEGQPGLNPSVVHPAAKFFEENKWVKIDNFIDRNMANLLYHHVQLEAKRLNYLDETLGKGNYDEDIWGTFTDTQAPGDFSKYGEPIFDTLLNLGVEQMEMLTGKKLIPTYSYHRLYTTGTELKRHKDRPSCEISTTLNLGGEPWPIFVDGTGGINNKGIQIDLSPGDMLVYSGCELEHWRESFTGNLCAQVFLHYNHVNGQFKNTNLFDGRPNLGLPSFTKGFKH